MKVLARAPRDNSSHISKKVLDYMQNLQRRLSKPVAHQLYVQVKRWIWGKYLPGKWGGGGAVVITTPVRQCLVFLYVWAPVHRVWFFSMSGHQRPCTLSTHLEVRNDYSANEFHGSVQPSSPLLPHLEWQLQKHFFFLFNSVEALQLINIYAKCLKEKILTISECIYNI